MIRVFFGVLLSWIFAKSQANHHVQFRTTRKPLASIKNSPTFLKAGAQFSSITNISNVTGDFQHPLKVAILPFNFKPPVHGGSNNTLYDVSQFKTITRDNKKRMPPVAIQKKLFGEKSGIISKAFQEASFGKITFSSTAFDYYDLDVPFSDVKEDEDGFIAPFHKQAIRESLKKEGKKESDFDLIITLANSPKYLRGGAYPPTRFENTRYAELAIGMLINEAQTFYDSDVTAIHEIGHTFGFSHTAINVTTEDLYTMGVIDDAMGREMMNLFYDYGDFFSTMGGYLSSSGIPLSKDPYFTAHQRAMAGWLNLDQALPIIPPNSNQKLHISNLATTLTSPDNKIFGCRIQVDFQRDPHRDFYRTQSKAHRYQLHIEMQNDPSQNPVVVIRAVADDVASLYDNQELDVLSLFVASLHKENDTYIYHLDPSYIGKVEIKLVSIQKSSAIVQILT